MLESITVTERLHWPKVELSKKSVLNSDTPALSPSHVYLDKFPTDVLKDLLTLRSSSYNVLLRAEDTETHMSPKRSPQRRRKTVKQGSSANKKKPPVMVSRKCQDGSKATQSNYIFSSSTSSLIPRSRLRKAYVPTVPSTKLPYLNKPLKLEEAENPRRPCILAAIKPTNVEQEKAKFFMSDFSYNPQFEYSNPLSPLVLAKHGSASDRFLTQAVHIMEVALQRYGSYERFEQVTGGSLLSKSRIWSSVKKYMEKEGCVGEMAVQVTDDLLSRASMSVVNSRPTLTINTATAREHWLEGMLRHEIGTHYFRGLNNVHQPWSSSAGRRRHNLRPLNPTEEGLASIHSVLFRRDPTLWRAALLYYTVHQASSMSFCQLFQCLGRFLQDPHTRWDYCVRAKRGQSDTALPGCFSKDQVYLDGVLKILRYRDKINFPLLMSLGKVSFEDVDRLKPLAQMDNIRIPHFMQDQSKYQEQLTKIMAVNQLTDQQLRTII
ncbi:putative tyrosine carboxypeptidase MATCAP2 isoform X2 [Eucyclogobius newberryi]|uniref:putative tyrosine carboxypeptidase MATCAP2 isoform X2 n=1 Tax=Eucyclogobius newberryi TaxID=166745 RepID=UPI003B5BA7AE